METHSTCIESLDIFSGISQEELQRMLPCFDAQKMNFQKGQTILTYQSSLQKIGILLSGQAHLFCIDYNGSYMLLEQFEKNGLFGELFSFPLDNLEYIVEADSSCEVLFLPYQSVIKRCPNACGHHSQLVDNLFHLATLKSQALSLRINLLSTRTIRQKLLNYLLWQQSQTGSTSFRLNMSLTALADYLCVDRSSMMRELRLLKEECILESKGRFITLYPSALHSASIPSNRD